MLAPYCGVSGRDLEWRHRADVVSIGKAPKMIDGGQTKRTMTGVPHVAWRFAELGIVLKMLMIVRLLPEGPLGPMEALESAFIAYGRTFTSADSTRQKELLLAEAC